MSGLPLKILVSGAGVAGPCAAFWLSKIKPSPIITIVERSPSPRKTGQAIDIRGPAVTVLRKMGLEEIVRAHHTQEKGIEKIGSTGKVVGRIDSTGDTGAQSFTSEFEILRADLAKIFADAVERRGIEIIYGEYVEALEKLTEKDGKMRVTFANGKQTEDYDLVVGADGTNSRTRSLITGRPAREDVTNFGGYVSYFTVPRSERDSPTHGRMSHFVGGRAAMIRPTPSKSEVGAYFMCINRGDSRLEEAVYQGPAAQKKILTETFKDAGWEADRLIAGMNAADDFYYQQMGLVIIERWAYDRAVLVGDASYATSGLTGMGTSLAMQGAYFLAGEIMNHPDDLQAGLQAYEDKLKPVVKKTHNVPWFFLRFMLPQTWWGIAIFNALFWVIATLRVPAIVAWIPIGKQEDQNIEQYNWPEEFPDEKKA